MKKRPVLHDDQNPEGGTGHTFAQEKCWVLVGKGGGTGFQRTEKKGRGSERSLCILGEGDDG